MYLFRLALKNLLRSKRRSILSSLAVVVGIFYLVVGRSFVGGVEEGTIRGAIDGVVGHLTLQPADYPDEPLTFPIDDLLTITPEMRSWLDGQKAWTDRLLFQTTVIVGQESSRAEGIAFDPERDGEVFSRATWQLDGVEPKTAADGVLIGQGLANTLGVKRGDTVVLRSRTALGAINALPIEVGGTVATGNIMLDMVAVFVSRDLAKDLLRTEGISHISALVSNRDLATEKAAEIGAIAGPGIATVTWITETEDLMRLQQFRRSALNVLVGMLLLMSSLAIANTILMAAHERVREIGTLRALGMNRIGVLKLFLFEGSLMGGIAGAIGAFSGGWVAWYLSQNPLDLGAMMAKQGTTNMPMSSFLYGEFNLPLVLVPLGISFVVALLASIYPAITASSMEPAEAVRAQ